MKTDFGIYLSKTAKNRSEHSTLTISDELASVSSAETLPVTELVSGCEIGQPTEKVNGNGISTYVYTKGKSEALTATSRTNASCLPINETPSAPDPSQKAKLIGQDIGRSQ